LEGDHGGVYSPKVKIPWKRGREKISGSTQRRGVRGNTEDLKGSYNMESDGGPTPRMVFVIEGENWANAHPLRGGAGNKGMLAYYPAEVVMSRGCIEGNSGFNRWGYVKWKVDRSWYLGYYNLIVEERKGSTFRTKKKPCW